MLPQVSQYVFTPNTLSNADPSGLEESIAKLRDICLDAIHLCMSKFPSPDSSPEDLAAWWRFFRQIRNSDEFWRTLINNTTLDLETPAPGVYAQMFELLFCDSHEVRTRRIWDEGRRSRFGFHFPRLQIIALK
jgi:hypothetical protein